MGHFHFVNVMTIGQTLKLLRVAAKIKQSELSSDLGISGNYLSMVENDRREPSLTLLKKFAQRLDVPLGYLLWRALSDEESEEAEELRSQMDGLLTTILRHNNNGNETS